VLENPKKMKLACLLLIKIGNVKSRKRIVNTILFTFKGENMRLNRFKVYWIFLLVIFFVISILTVSAYSKNTKERQEDRQEQLKTIIDEYLSDKPGVLGTIVHVDIHGQESYRAANGYFDLSKNTPLKSTDRFMIGSITKVFTATLVLQLVENGKVKLDGPLIDYLPPDLAAVLEKVKYGREITVKHALSHRSGMFDVLSFSFFSKYVIPDPSRRWTPLEVFAMAPELGEPYFKPGKAFNYTNANFLLLAALIENVTQKQFEKVLQENILSKLGLENTFLYESPSGLPKKRIAHGYLKINDILYDGQEFDVSCSFGAGGIISTTADLIKFIRVLTSGKLYKNKKTLAQMIERVGDNKLYGLGIEVIGDTQTGIYYGHRGSFGNTSSIACYFPQHNIIICICHTYDGTARRLPTDALMKLVMRNLFGIHVIDESTNEENVLEYSELNFEIKEIQKFEKYTINEKAFKPDKNNRLFLIRLEGRTSEDAALRYTPSKVSLQYTVKNEALSAECLAVGQIFNTKSGIIEIWLTSEEEGYKTKETADRKDNKIILYLLFELPDLAANIKVLFN
jgi:D-alanyl-D-alanine carboxypeptidase